MSILDKAECDYCGKRVGLEVSINGYVLHKSCWGSLTPVTQQEEVQRFMALPPKSSSLSIPGGRSIRC